VQRPAYASGLLIVSDPFSSAGYKDYADAHRQKSMTLSAEEFLRRFVQHVLPKGFVKVRHYGLLANRGRQAKLTLCRQLLFVASPTESMPDVKDESPTIAPAPERCCPQCGSQRLHYIELGPATERTDPAADTS